MWIGGRGCAGRSAGEDRNRDRQRQTPPSSGIALEPASAEEQDERRDRGSRNLDRVEAECPEPPEVFPRQQKRDEQSQAEHDARCVGGPPQAQTLAPAKDQRADRGDPGTREAEIEAVGPARVRCPRRSRESPGNLLAVQVDLHCHGDCEVSEPYAQTPNRKAGGEPGTAEGCDGRKDGCDDEEDGDVSGDGEPAQDAAVLEEDGPCRAEDDTGRPRLAPRQKEARQEDERGRKLHEEREPAVHRTGIYFASQARN
jgi:hypothetical protein